MTDNAGPQMKLVLVTPEIPYNTGAIGRTCLALDVELILIKPYGFSLEEKAVRRAGMDYWKHVHLSEYDSWQSFLEARTPSRDTLHFFENYGEHSFYKPAYLPGSYLVFGCESKGLPADVLAGMDDRVLHLPMPNPKVRSLNLANTATAVLFQALRPHLGG